MDDETRRAIDELRAETEQQTSRAISELTVEMRMLGAEIREAIARVEHQGELRIAAPLSPEALKDAREDALRHILGRLHEDLEALTGEYRSIQSFYLFEFTQFRRWLQDQLTASRSTA